MFAIISEICEHLCEHVREYGGNHDVWGIPTREGLGGNVPSWEFEGMDSLKIAARQRGCPRQQIFFQIGGLEGLNVCINKNVN
eukprot:scaffold4446_cov272-Chaetoceros_neogracile.AAC.6